MINTWFWFRDRIKFRYSAWYMCVGSLDQHSLRPTSNNVVALDLGIVVVNARLTFISSCALEIDDFEIWNVYEVKITSP